MNHEPTSTAVVSGDGRYRYRLSRTWGTEVPMVFIMLNPSTADAEQDDPTIRRCIGFAKREGCEGIVVVNLFAYRAANPKSLWQQPFTERVGPDNDDHIAWAFRHASIHGSPIVAAWGSHPQASTQAVRIAQRGVRLQCLGRTKDGDPRHPLYVRADAPFEWWPR